MQATRGAETRWAFFIDRGGTFTDCIGLSPEGEVRVTKVLSSDQAPIEGIRALLGLPAEARIPPCSLRMGTTVATNALLERRGTPTAVVITRGFADALTIGTQARSDLFALEIDRPPPLADAVIEVEARVAPDGQAHFGPAWAEPLAADLAALRDDGLESAAVVLVGAWRGDEAEAEVARVVTANGFRHVSRSSEVAPEIGLVGRGDTTVVDAYLTPLLEDYLATLESALPGSELALMQSSGGLCAASAFRGKNAVLSGPAGGVVAARAMAQAAGFDRAIAFDMGGTSTDVTRIGKELERTWETEIAGVRLRAPMMDIHTVAAGGGSVCRREGPRLVVGPESAGARPGPLAYGHPDATEIAITDVNLVLGRLRPERFPFPLDRERARAGLAAAAETGPGAFDSPETLAEGFLEVAHEVMAQAIRKVTVARGHDVRDHALVVFGGAGGQHAAALARRLDIDTVVFPPFSGVLSALGMALADLDAHRVRGAERAPLDAPRHDLEAGLDADEASARAELEAQGVSEDRQEVFRRLDLAYRGTETPLTLNVTSDEAAETTRARFEAEHERQFGFRRPEHPVEILAGRVEVRGRSRAPRLKAPPDPRAPESFVADLWVGGRWRSVPVYAREALTDGQTLRGPALVLEATGTLVVEDDFTLTGGTLLVMRRNERAVSSALPAASASRSEADPVRLEVYNHRYMAIAERMGTALRRSAHSVNIRERLDFSCAVFDGDGNLVANAPHIPVHLGAMSESVRAVTRAHPRMAPGDVYVTNDPAAGGSHLPDITVVTPVFQDGRRRFFTASRGHHEDVGGITPGSMPPFSNHLSEEGVVLRALPLARAGTLELDAVRSALEAGPHPARRPGDNVADLLAKMAANATGARLLGELVREAGSEEVEAYMRFVQADAARRVGDVLEALPDGRRSFTDALDDGTPVVVTLDISGRRMRVDFTGTGSAVAGNLNAPRAVTVAATLYVLRALVGAAIPLNSGCLEPIELIVPPGSLLDPPPGAAVAGGNVETSQRVVDVLLGALGRAAASQGTMNNLTFGDDDFGYYETIAGGAGATPRAPGVGGVHTHMTNTRITDPEILESRFPVRVLQFGLRRGSGGAGRHRGGDGVIREIEALRPLRVSILSERRERPPFGLDGGGAAEPGRNFVEGRAVGAKVTTTVREGGRIRIETPGGGGYGAPDVSDGTSSEPD